MTTLIHNQIWGMPQKLKSGAKISPIMPFLCLKKKKLWYLAYQSCCFHMERPAGIGPVYTAWEAIVLPLNYGRKNGAPEGAPKGFNVRIRQNQRWQQRCSSAGYPRLGILLHHHHSRGEAAQCQYRQGWAYRSWHSLWDLLRSPLFLW